MGLTLSVSYSIPVSFVSSTTVLSAATVEAIPSINTVDRPLTLCL